MSVSEYLPYLPWIAILFVILIDRIEFWILIGVVRDALARAQDSNHALATNPVPTPAPIVVQQPPPVVVHPPAPSPAPAPVPSGPFANAPAWFQLALHEIGFHETGNNQGISRYIGMAKTGSEGDPWCAIFANAMLEQAGITGTRSPSSQSFRTNPNFVQLSGPALGAIVVYWRGSADSGLGHVGFYRGEDSTRIWTLGGNENDAVLIEALPKSSASFGLIGYWWPRGAPMPAVSPVIMPTGSPVSVQTDPSGTSSAAQNAPAASPSVPNGIQTNITATMFGGMKSAYGPPIDDNSPGVALPYRFPDPRPRVRVSNPKTGASIDCDVVDVGPWNINDPYWLTGARPEAESGTDLGQVGAKRPTNKAGIDLTLAAAKAVGIDGKGLCNWQFIDNPKVS